MLKSKVKMPALPACRQNYNSKFKKNQNNKFIKFTFCYVIFAFVFYILHLSPAHAYYYFPIPELGYCRDTKECRLFCQIPVNTPACWSYHKYVMMEGDQVLGTSTVSLTYPIAQLDNCSSPEVCFAYCQKIENLKTCLDFANIIRSQIETNSATSPSVSDQAQNQKLEAAKLELGCDGKQACLALCQSKENYAKCSEFAKKNGLEKAVVQKFNSNVTQEIAKAAQTELGCDNEYKCQTYCNNPDNKKSCLEFARKNNLIKPPPEMANEEAKAKIIEEAKEILHCDSYSACASLCDRAEFKEKCMILAKKYNLAPTQKPGDITKDNTAQTAPRKNTLCSTEIECRQYCEKNPADCPGFVPGGQNTDLLKTLVTQDKSKPVNNLSNNSGGGFIGPSGCKSQGECESYCKEHPQECPGFPQPTVNQTTPNPDLANPNSPPSATPTILP